MQYLLAFLVGGAICAVGQLLMDLTPLAPAHVLVLFVSLGAVLSGLGIYEKLVQVGGAGATIPLTGFGHAIVSGIFEEIDAKGAVGILSGIFKNTSMGLAAAIFFGFLMAVFFNPKG